jgi:hypothetical protein
LCRIKCVNDHTRDLHQGDDPLSHRWFLHCSGSSELG